MKIKPEDLILDANLKLNNNAYYISGNDETYIKKIESIISEGLKKRGFVSKKFIDSVEEYNRDSNLFFESEIIIINTIKNVNEKFIEGLEKNKDAFIIVAKNKSGDSGLKKIFEKNTALSLLLCYELNRDLKAKLLNFYKNKHSFNIDKDAYWHLIDIVDNRFVFFEKEIQKLLLINDKIIGISQIRRTLSLQDNKNFESLFFALLLKNKSIVNLYNSLISTPSDLQLFLQKTKFFLEIIIVSKSTKDAEEKFPRYLFKEKPSFLKIYRDANKSNLTKIIKLVYDTEKALRKNSVLFRFVGFVFVLRLKKLMFSA